MSDSPPFEIDLSQPINAFEDHLALDGNNRIFFSGLFGIGKTYFLEKFFAQKQEKYLTFRLSPVNYSVSSNDDIFDLIKYDLLLQLIEHDGFEVDLIDPDFDEGSFHQVFFLYRFYHILSGLLTVAAELPGGDENPLIGAANFVGKTIDKLVQAIGKLKEKYEADKARLKGTAEKTALEAFEKRIQALPFYRLALVDQIIREGLSQLTHDNEGNPARESVLIIDDLDRLDPAHIFRLLNVFSVHFHEEGQNRFGFDRVIVVGDIQNVRSIFQAQYGQETDFSGYIDKFYAKEVFSFQNPFGIKTSILDYLRQNLPLPRRVQKDRWNLYLESQLTIVLLLMYYANSLTLRSIIRLTESAHHELESRIGNILIPNGQNSSRRLSDMWGARILKTLEVMFGDPSSVKSAIKKSIHFHKFSDISNTLQVQSQKTESIARAMLLIATYRDHHGIECSNFSFKADEFEIIYDISNHLLNEIQIHPKEIITSAIDTREEADQAKKRTHIAHWMDFFLFSIMEEAYIQLQDWKSQRASSQSY